MQLILWRHAEAEDYASSDLARALTPKGQRQAAKMAAWLKAQEDVGASSWRIIASPALRTRQTAQALALPFQTEPAIAPDVSADAVLAAAGWPQGGTNVLVVGHQPTLGSVVARLIDGADGHVSIKKGAMWWFEMKQKDGVLQTVLKAMASPDMVG